MNLCEELKCKNRSTFIIYSWILTKFESLCSNGYETNRTWIQMIQFICILNHNNTQGKIVPSYLRTGLFALWFNNDRGYQLNFAPLKVTLIFIITPSVHNVVKFFISHISRLRRIFWKKFKIFRSLRDYLHSYECRLDWIFARFLL
jgi:hypothetical protein